MTCPLLRRQHGRRARLRAWRPLSIETISLSAKAGSDPQKEGNVAGLTRKAGSTAGSRGSVLFYAPTGPHRRPELIPLQAAVVIYPFRCTGGTPRWSNA